MMNLKSMGYELTRDDDKYRVYQKIKVAQVVFYKASQFYQVDYQCDRGSRHVTLQLHDAIQNEIKDMGWKHARVDEGSQT